MNTDFYDRLVFFDDEDREARRGILLHAHARLVGGGHDVAARGQLPGARELVEEARVELAVERRFGDPRANGLHATPGDVDVDDHAGGEDLCAGRTAAAVREALKAKETGEETVILTALCGHGHFDLAAYDAYLSGKMVDEDVTDARINEGLATVPSVG